MALSRHPATTWTSFRQVLAITLVLPALTVHADDSDARYWLEKMGTALREENYVGVFTFMRGTEFNTMRIAHRFEDGRETERLFTLNGKRREISRTDGDVTCYYAGEVEDTLACNISMGPFTHLFNQNITQFQDLYRFAVRGEDRVADRRTVVLDISPKSGDRYGYRLWLDHDTGLLLQSHLVESQRVRELFQFVEVEIGGTVDEKLLAVTVDENTISHKLTAKVLDKPERPGMRVSWLPRGFKQVQSGTNRVHFSDGIANFSVFIERGAKLPDMSTRLGGRTVVTRSLNGKGQITVIGEVPFDTAEKVAESVEPVIY